MNFAVLGYEPLFNPGLRFVQPSLPPWKVLAPYFKSSIKSGMVSKGEFLEQYEAKVTKTLQVKHAVGVSSCTSGLTLLALALGLRNEVIVPSFSFFATFHSLVWSGIKPVFVDCEPGTFTLDIKAADAAVTPRTEGVVATHVFGNPADCDALVQWAKKRHLALFFDAAHGFGSLYHNKPLGSYGAGEVFSTTPTKLLVTGEGGVVTTQKLKTAEFVKVAREYGNDGSYDCSFAGLNARMSELHAAMGIAGLDYLEPHAVKRNIIAQRYIRNLNRLEGISFQTIRANCRSSYKDFAIVINAREFGVSRDELQAILAAEGVPTRTYFNPPGHQLKTYRKAMKGVELNYTESLSQSILCLPIYGALPLTAVDSICKIIASVPAQKLKLRKALKA